MLYVRGEQGTLFDDRSIEPYGVKLLGNYQFTAVEGEPRTLSRGYVSPGHNSAYYDPVENKYFLLFHTRFLGRGDYHEVRVHQMFLNEDGWFVVSPHRYAGETLEYYSNEELLGEYKLINHGKRITTDLKKSKIITLEADSRISGAVVGEWYREDGNYLNLVIDANVYRGVLLRQWDDDQRAWVMTFSVLSPDGVALWGSKVVSCRESQ